MWRTDPGAVSQQHHPTELPNGNILVFDNGVFRPGHDVPYSRVIEIDRAGKIAWEYHDPARESFFAPFMGAAQRLPNGNTLVTDSPAGRLFEVTADGLLVWEYAVIAVMGVQMLARSDLTGRGQSMIAALALAAGLLPIVAPALNDAFPGWVRTLLGSGVVAGTLAAVLLHALFAVADRPPRTGPGEQEPRSPEGRPLTTRGPPRSADRAPAPPGG